MAEFVCPPEIAALFDDDGTVAHGRHRAVEWLETLTLNMGDRVWLPHIGWTTKTMGRA